MRKIGRIDGLSAGVFEALEEHIRATESWLATVPTPANGDASTINPASPAGRVKSSLDRLKRFLTYTTNDDKRA